MVNRLLDTNIVIALFGSDPKALRQFNDASGHIYLSSVCIGELYFGAQKSARVADNVRRIEQYAAKSRVIDVDTSTAAKFGEIKFALARKGRPIPDNDIWIAALAVQHALSLVTRDAHFSAIEGLPVEAW